MSLSCLVDHQQQTEDREKERRERVVDMKEKRIIALLHYRDMILLFLL